MSKKDFEIDIPTELYEELEALAKKGNVSLDDFISYVIEEEIKKMMDKQDTD